MRFELTPDTWHPVNTGSQT